MLHLSKLLDKFSPKLEVAFLQSSLCIAAIGGGILAGYDLLLRQFSWVFLSVDLILIIIASLGLYYVRKIPAKKLTVFVSLVFGTSVALQATQIPMEGMGIAMSALVMMGVFSSLMLDGKTRLIVVASLFLMIFGTFGLRILLMGGEEGLPPVEMVRVALPYGIIYMVSIFSPAVLKAFYRRQQRHLEKANHAINQKNEEISIQHANLEEANKELSRLNAQLEKLVTEKNQGIDKRDMKISRYAFMNAHGVRGHMARILGLLQLMRMGADDNAQLLKMLEEEAENMEKTISEVGRQLYHPPEEHKIQR